MPDPDTLFHAWRELFGTGSSSFTSVSTKDMLDRVREAPTMLLCDIVLEPEGSLREWQKFALTWVLCQMKDEEDVMD